MLLVEGVERVEQGHGALVDSTFNASHAARCVACHGVRSHAESVALVGEFHGGRVAALTSDQPVTYSGAPHLFLQEQEGIVMRPMPMASALLMVLALGGSAVGQQNAVILLTPAEITWTTRPDGGKISVIEGNLRDAGSFTMRVIVPAGWSHPPLSHPVAEHLTVLSGTFYIGKGEKFDASEMKALPAGSFMVMPPNTPHFAMVREEATVQIHGTGPWASRYVNPADDPTKK